MLGDFHLLDLLSQGGAISGSVLRTVSWWSGGIAQLWRPCALRGLEKDATDLSGDADPIERVSICEGRGELVA